MGWIIRGEGECCQTFWVGSQGNRILLGENFQQIVSFPTSSFPLTRFRCDCPGTRILSERGFGGITGIRGMGETATANGNGRLIREGTRRGGKKSNGEGQRLLSHGGTGRDREKGRGTGIFGMGGVAGGFPPHKGGPKARPHNCSGQRRREPHCSGTRNGLSLAVTRGVRDFTPSLDCTRLPCALACHISLPASCAAALFLIWRAMSRNRWIPAGQGAPVQVRL